MRLAADLAVGAVRVYQWTLRPVIGANCRFFPSCSDYAIEAFREHGAARGGALAARRILRCNPWCDGGYDPVPPAHEANPAHARATEHPAHARATEHPAHTRATEHPAHIRATEQ